MATRVHSPFQSSGPVVGADFVGRGEPLTTLLKAADDLKHGVRRLYCLLGHRKIGKSSLLCELVRRLEGDPDLLICRVDLYEANTPALFFAKLTLALLDAYLVKKRQGPILSGLLDDLSALTLATARLESLRVRAIDRALRSALEVIQGARGSGRHYRPLIEFPAELARETGLRLVVIVDEFQELSRFAQFKEVRAHVGDMLKLIRARWQQHTPVSYVISGSEITLLEEMISAPHAPLFGHFIPLRLGPFDRAFARSFVTERFALADIEISVGLAERLVDIAGGHPFYLQVLGEDLCLRADRGPLPEDLFKESIQDALFSSTGRLFLHFAGLFREHVKRSRTLEQVLVALATDHRTVTEMAEMTHQRTGAVSTALQTLVARDAVSRTIDGTYAIEDAMFKLWLAGTRSALRTIAGPYHLGDEAERAMCQHLGREGFHLVYRSRGSRGAFDLLALLDTRPIGIQVKRRCDLPVYLDKTEHTRMVEMGRELGWLPVLAVCCPEESRFHFFDVRKVGVALRTQVRFDAGAARDHLLEIVLGDPASATT